MESSRIFIKGLPPNITESDFRKHFSANNREITDIKLIPHRRIGYVGYKTNEDASKAVKYFNKSFVRMSKISVELAKPITDPSLPKVHQGRTPSTTTAADGQVQEQQSDASAKAKKRKRELSEPSDAKLHEFIQVMKPGRAGVIADELSTVLVEDKSKPGAAIVPERESDDEYEHIPTRKQKSRKLETSTVEDPSSRPALSANETIPDAASNFRNDRTDEPTVAEHQSRMSEAADVDWLRSRTSRLLDLDEPDDRVVAEEGVRQEEGSPERATTNMEEENHSSGETTHDTTGDKTPDDEAATLGVVEAISRTSRLFVRNLPYSASEEEIREAFEKFGSLDEVHMPTTTSGSSRGFALVLFCDPLDAVKAFQSMDGMLFQGRIIHIIPAQAKKSAGLDEYGISKLPLRKQNLLRKRAEAASNNFNWNSLFMSQDAVNTSVANRLGVSKAELLDPTSADAAVKQAIAETSVIQETKAFFAANGVDLEAFKSRKRGDTCILVKNFPYGTTVDELRRMFEESGPVLRVLMPPSGTMAIVEFAQAKEAKAAFSKQAYRRIKDSVLFLEKAPKDLFKQGHLAAQGGSQAGQGAGPAKQQIKELLSGGDEASEAMGTSLFIGNLSFATTTSRLAEAFQSLDGFVLARVKTKKDPKRSGQVLSMGFGFVEFGSKSQALAAVRAMDGHVLDGHQLNVKVSHKGQDAAEERRREDGAKRMAAQRTKIIVKNLPFQATKKDIRTLFGTYGQLKSVRVPKKADYTTRGFAFADFVSPREAENALNALRDTHLLGRRLVLEYAAAEAIDAEEEIEKMQRKVGGQANKVALQQLTAGGRKKINIGNNEEPEEEFGG